MLEQHYFPMSEDSSSIGATVAACILILGITAVAMYVMSNPADRLRYNKDSRQLKQALQDNE